MSNENTPLPDLAALFPAGEEWSEFLSLTIGDSVLLSLGIDPAIIDGLACDDDYSDGPDPVRHPPHYGQQHEEYGRRKTLASRAVRAGLLELDAKGAVNLVSFVKWASVAGWTMPPWLNELLRGPGAPRGRRSDTVLKWARIAEIAQEVIDGPVRPQNQRQIANAVHRRMAGPDGTQPAPTSNYIRNVLFNSLEARFKGWRP